MQSESMNREKQIHQYQKRKDFFNMSQKKVDQYKKDKANRKKLIAKQKRHEFLTKLALGIVTLAFIGFIAVSAYFKWFDKKEDTTTTETATYSLSEEEISSIWEAYTEESETTVADETTHSSETDSTAADSEDTTADEETTASEEETTSAE